MAKRIQRLQKVVPVKSYAPGFSSFKFQDIFAVLTDEVTGRRVAANDEHVVPLSPPHFGNATTNPSCVFPDNLKIGKSVVRK